MSRPFATCISPRQARAPRRLRGTPAPSTRVDPREGTPTEDRQQIPLLVRQKIATVVSGDRAAHGGRQFPIPGPRPHPSAPTLNVPAELLDLAARHPHVTLLVDVDPLSHASDDLSVHDSTLRDYLARAVAAARQVGVITSRWFACSSVTARTHLDVMLDAPNNTWRVAYGLDGADRMLLGELHSLGSEAARRHLDHAVVLVGADHCYADQVARLRERGVPTWLLTPPTARVAKSLQVAATATARL